MSATPIFDPREPRPRPGAVAGRLSFLRREQVALLLLLALLAIPWLHGITRGEIHLITDETRHAMSGLFLYDFLHDLPLRAPLQYAYEYYGKYPAVSIGHWPPGFYFVEALFYAVFGLSVVAGRLAVLAFAVLGVAAWYKILRMYVAVELAVAATVVYACLPAILLYEKTTMLEIPVLSLTLAAIYFWLKLLSTSKARFVYLLALFASWAMLTKQTAIMLPAFLVLHLVVERKWNLLKWKHTYIAAAGAAVLVMPWYLIILRLHPQSMGQAIGYITASYHPRLSEVFGFYLRGLVRDLGIPLLVLAFLGIIAALWRRERAMLKCFLTLIVATYATFTFLSDKASRYAMVWLLPLAFFAVYLAWNVFRRWPKVATVAVFVFASIYYGKALVYQRPYVEGCREAAQYVLQQPDSDVIYYQGLLNGDFIFFVRKFDPEKRRVVLREKPLTVGVEEHKKGAAMTAAELRELFQSSGIRYLVVENRDFTPELAITHEVLRSSDFELLKTIPIQTNDYRVAGIALQIFRNHKARSEPASTVDIPMDTLPHDLVLPLARLAGRPWPATNKDGR